LAPGPGPRADEGVQAVHAGGDAPAAGAAGGGDDARMEDSAGSPADAPGRLGEAAAPRPAANGGSDAGAACEAAGRGNSGGVDGEAQPGEPAGLGRSDRAAAEANGALASAGARPHLCLWAMQ